MTTENIHYWGYRIDKTDIPFFRAELEQGRLRQGWGGPGQDLRDPSGSSFDRRTRRNLRMLQVKKGHILLVPELPERDRVAIVEATEDWESGYRFEVPAAEGDYGHIFPARLLKSFVRETAGVSGDVRKSLRYVGRFWTLDPIGADIEVLRRTSQADLDAGITDEKRLSDAVQEAFKDAFKEEQFGTSVYDRLNHEFDNTRWENVLVRVLRTRYPAPCEVRRVGGRAEKEHGTDILVLLPGVGEGPRHAIAVQVKDYDGVVGRHRHPVDQIIKAEWWDGKDSHSVVEKVVILTKASREENPKLVEYANEKEVRLVFAEDLKEMLTEYAKRTMGLPSSD